MSRDSCKLKDVCLAGEKEGGRKKRSKKRNREGKTKERDAYMSRRHLCWALLPSSCLGMVSAVLCDTDNVVCPAYPPAHPGLNHFR